jgi:oxygen-independent coproporphyrinogen-3 oxidase
MSVKAAHPSIAHQYAMWSYHPQLLARPVPRYTSYPTAAEFHDGVGARNQATALDTLPAGTPVSLYVHIPFCREICWYCGCNTGAANREGRLDVYLQALDAEIALVARHLGGRGRVARIAFGGGSPNAISPLSFVRLLDRLITQFDAASAEISIELDPRTLDQSWFDVLRLTGVARASLGVQTFAPHIQQAIGRIQPQDMITRAVEELRQAGVRSVNFDLMYGLPRQRLIDLDETLDQAVALAPDRIALFGYAHLPSAIARQRRIHADTLPDAHKRFEQAALGYRKLTAAGYRAIGFDHFALPGDALAIAAGAGRLHRNFQGFTDDPCTVTIGLGASAISEFPDVIVQNEKMSGRYSMLMAGGHLAGRRGTLRSADDRLRGAAIERLLCDGGVELSDRLMRDLRPALRPFIDLGLIRCGAHHIAIEQVGLPYARVIASSLDHYRNDTTGTFSHAV